MNLVSFNPILDAEKKAEVVGISLCYQRKLEQTSSFWKVIFLFNGTLVFGPRTFASTGPYLTRFTPLIWIVNIIYPEMCSAGYWCNLQNKLNFQHLILRYLLQKLQGLEVNVFCITCLGLKLYFKVIVSWAQAIAPTYLQFPGLTQLCLCLSLVRFAVNSHDSLVLNQLQP